MGAAFLPSETKDCSNIFTSILLLQRNNPSPSKCMVYEKQQGPESKNAHVTMI